MFLNLTLASGHTSPIMASGILNPALAYLPCSRALHVKCKLLLKDLITLPDIGTNTGQRRRISLPVRGAGYELLIPFRGYSAKLKRERNQRSLSLRPHARAERAIQSFRDDDTSTPFSFRHARRRQGSTSQKSIHITYYVQGRREPAGPRTLPDRSLDRVVEGELAWRRKRTDGWQGGCGWLSHCALI